VLDVDDVWEVVLLPAGGNIGGGGADGEEDEEDEEIDEDRGCEECDCVLDVDDV